MSSHPLPDEAPDRRPDEHVPPGDQPAGLDPDQAPFGLPVLAEVPELAGLLTDLVAADRALARAVEAIILLEDHHVAESTTGVGLRGWLAGVARRTGSDRRMLTTAAQACRRLPSLRSAFAQGRVSWSQVRAVALKVERLPRHLDDALDEGVADAIAGAAGADPDALARAVQWVLASIESANDLPPEPTQAPEHDVVALQPRLDGSGGQLFGDFGPVGFATLDAALAVGPPEVEPTRERFGDEADPDRSRTAGRQLGRVRAQRLLDLCSHAISRRHDAGPTGDRQLDGNVGLDGDAEVARDTRSAGTPTQVLLRCELSSLLGHDRLPGQLLTHLAGGAMQVDAATARRISDAGAHVRLVVTDRGRVVGVGRRRRQPPGWVRDAVLALHDTCSEPGCRRAARTCHLDHAAGWESGAGTDLDQLAPLCGTANHTKETSGWRATQDTDGTRRWHHPRSGLRIDTLPATWRPERYYPPLHPDPTPPADHAGDGHDQPAAPDPAVEAGCDPPEP